MTDIACESRIDMELRHTIEVINRLWHLYKQDPETSDYDYGSFEEYGLSFDYVPADTFEEQEQGYFRYQLSWGGPSDEFRFYCDPELNCYCIEYVFMDWFDGATRELSGADRELLMQIWDCYFSECAEYEIERAEV